MSGNCKSARYRASLPSQPWEQNTVCHRRTERCGGVRCCKAKHALPQARPGRTDGRRPSVQISSILIPSLSLSKVVEALMALQIKLGKHTTAGKETQGSTHMEPLHITWINKRGTGRQLAHEVPQSHFCPSGPPGSRERIVCSQRDEEERSDAWCLATYGTWQQHQGKTGGPQRLESGSPSTSWEMCQRK